MKSRFVIFIAMMACSIGTSAQVNLVPNGGFEDTIHCPDNASEISFALGWSAPTVGGTSDYFNVCSTPSPYGVGVPSNGIGHQFARTGNGYAGFYTYYNTASLREYIQAKLDTILKPAHQYCVEFYVSLADTVLIACNSIGAYFSDTSINANNSYPLNVVPQISNINLILTDKTNWIKITGSFVATGGENYITIGNFLNDSNSDTLLTSNGTYHLSYYYIDDISVVDCTGIGIDELSRDRMHFKLYPNPNNGTMQLSYSLSENETGYVSFFSIMGEKLATYPLINGSSILNIKETNLVNGVYFYQVYKNNTKVFSGKIIISK